jgi:Dehydrogenases with different specificities (related to short-chain alcohol dehydrogenases)
MKKIDYNFKDRTAVITGGAQGFGLDIAKRFLDSGAKVIIWDMDAEMTDKAVKDLNNPNLSSNKMMYRILKRYRNALMKF